MTRAQAAGCKKLIKEQKARLKKAFEAECLRYGKVKRRVLGRRGRGVALASFLHQTRSLCPRLQNPPSNQQHES